MKSAFLILTVLTVAMVSCQQAAKQQGSTKTTNATLFWTGEIAADGCGFEVMIDGKNFLPQNEDAIPAVYKESDSTQVKLTYMPLPEPIDRRCGMLPQPRVMEAIRIISVESL
ncbi:hypothetical protein ACSX1A_03375 [Pontibacter sp. MBLB2868]|uniref:hypothetical protein n=1 Tax=Pontibacter sp. MBLB2868 TaxID=3451555 RepID=UPI003F75613B